MIRPWASELLVNELSVPLYLDTRTKKLIGCGHTLRNCALIPNMFVFEILFEEPPVALFSQHLNNYTVKQII